MARPSRSKEKFSQSLTIDNLLSHIRNDNEREVSDILRMVKIDSIAQRVAIVNTIIKENLPSKYLEQVLVSIKKDVDAPRNGVKISIDKLYENFAVYIFSIFSQNESDNNLNILKSFNRIFPEIVKHKLLLLIAVQNNRLQYVNFLVNEAKNDVNVMNEGLMGQFTPLQFACSQGFYDAAKILLDSKASVNELSIPLRRTALHFATEKGDQKIAELLLRQQSLDPNVSDINGVKPLHLAAVHGYLDIAKIIIEKEGVDLNCEDFVGYTPLICAVEHGHKEVVQMLLSAGTDIKKGAIPIDNGKDFYDAFMVAIATGKIEIAQMLLDAGADVNGGAPAQITPLGLAISVKNIAVINILLERGADVGRMLTGPHDINNQSPLDFAIAMEECDEKRIIIKALIKKIKDSGLGDRFVRDAIMQGESNALKHLIANGLHEEFNLEKALIAMQSEDCKITQQEKDEIVKVFEFFENVKKDVSVNEFGPLHFVARHCSADVVRNFIERGFDVNQISDEGYAPIHYATLSGNAENIEVLAEKGADLNFVFSGNEVTPLHIASSVTKNIDNVKVLLELGANPQIHSFGGYASFHMPCFFENEDEGLDMLKAFAGRIDVDDRTDNEGKTAFQIAVDRRSFKIAHFFIELGADINAKDNAGRSTLCNVVMKDDNDNIKVVKFLLENGADFSDVFDGEKIIVECKNNKDEITEMLSVFSNPKNLTREGKSLLQLLIEEGNIKNLLSFIKNKNLDINSLNAKSQTALHIAIKEKKFDIFLALIELGADVEVLDSVGNNLLHYAVNSGDYRFVSKLLSLNKSDINAVNKLGLTPLNFAASKSKIIIANALLEKGANPNICDNFSESPLHKAMKNKNKSPMAIYLVENLLAGGADMNNVNNQNESPLSLIGDDNDLKEIFSIYQNPTMATPEGILALHKIALNGNFDLFVDFVEKGANPLAKDSKGESPLDNAIVRCRVDIVEYVLGLGLSIDEKDLLKSLEQIPDMGDANARAGAEKTRFIIAEYIKKSQDLKADVLRAREIADAKNASEKLLQNAKSAKEAQDAAEKGLFIAMFGYDFAGFVKNAEFLKKNNVEFKNIKSIENVNILNYAIIMGEKDIIKYILENNLMSVNDRGALPLFGLKLPIEIYVHCRGYKDENQEDIIKILLDYGAKIPQDVDLNYEGCEVGTKKRQLIQNARFLEAIKSGDLNFSDNQDGIELDEFFNEDRGGPIINCAQNEEMRNKLQYLLDIALFRNVERISRAPEDKKLVENLVLLLKNGANPNAVDIEGCSPLFFVLNNIQAMRVLLQYGAGANVNNNYGCTPLFYANNNEAIKILIENGAEIEWRDQYGCTPLLFAICNYNEVLATKLIKAGADPDAFDRNFLNAQALCQAVKNKAIFWQNDTLIAKAISIENGLVEQGLSLFDNKNQISEDGSSHLHLAVKNGHYNVVDLLISKGYDINLLNKDGRTPLDMIDLINEDDDAVRKITDILQKHGAKKGEEVVQVSKMQEEKPSTFFGVVSVKDLEGSDERGRY